MEENKKLAYKLLSNVLMDYCEQTHKSPGSAFRELRRYSREYWRDLIIVERTEDDNPVMEVEVRVQDQYKLPDRTIRKRSK